jgi:tetratricopeptide (TPR) repeat protein
MGLFGLGSMPARAEGSPRVGLMVTKQASLEHSREAVASGEGRGSPLPLNALLAGEKLYEATADCPAVWFVEMLDRSGRRGFVLATDVARVSRRLDGLKEGELALRRSVGEVAVQPPFSVRTHENEQLREAWAEATAAITENNALPAPQRLPDPYFARAEVYLQVGDVVAALDDCASASAIVSAGGLDSRKHQRVAEIYTTAIKRLRSMPQPPKDTFTNIDLQASEHFNAAQQSIAAGDFRNATEELTKALSLTPSRPLYWYMRAIARRAVGDLQRAQSDALLGALFERRLSPPAKRDLSKGLTRVQGPTRLWLEAFRRGGVDTELLGLEL